MSMILSPEVQDLGIYGRAFKLVNEFTALLEVLGNLQGLQVPPGNGLDNDRLAQHYEVLLKGCPGLSLDRTQMQQTFGEGNRIHNEIRIFRLGAFPQQISGHVGAHGLRGPTQDLPQGSEKGGASGDGGFFSSVIDAAEAPAIENLELGVFRRDPLGDLPYIPGGPLLPVMQEPFMCQERRGSLLGFTFAYGGYKRRTVSCSH